MFIEQLESNPAKYLPEVADDDLSPETVVVDLNRPMDEIRTLFAQHPVRTRLSLNGTIIVARDAAHARLQQRLDAGFFFFFFLYAKKKKTIGSGGRRPCKKKTKNEVFVLTEDCCVMCVGGGGCWVWEKKTKTGEELPAYFKDHIIYYAGPAKTPDGYASGSFGPTTAGFFFQLQCVLPAAVC